MTPEHLLAAQADLLWFSEQPMFRRINAGVIGSGTHGRGEPVTREDHAAQAMSANLTGLVRTAYAYRVTPDMCLMLQHAAASLDDSDTFDATLAPTGCGLVHFEAPLPVTDARGNLMLMHWLVWGPARWRGPDGVLRSGALLSWFNDRRLNPDHYARMIDHGGSVPQIEAAVGRWSFIGIDLVAPGTPVGENLKALDWLDAAQILADGGTPHPHTNTIRYVHALWLLLNQTITDVREERPRKTAVRLARRMQLPGRVTVIQLRRTEAHREPGESLVAWSHRWVVRGHWRWQRVGPGRAERVRIWIAPHVKGPEGMPLVVPDKVYDLSR